MQVLLIASNTQECYLTPTRIPEMGIRSVSIGWSNIHIKSERVKWLQLL